MTNIRFGRWLLVAVAVLGLAVAAPVVSAHDNGPAADDAAPYNGTADEWATWMEGHATDHMGPGSVEWMESHMGVTIDEMAQDMADDEYDHRNGHYDDHIDGYDDHRGYGPGYGC